jgi:hypothetical protein
LDRLVTAIKFNHNITKSHFTFEVNGDVELENYRKRITQLTLPHRFGAGKTQTKNLKAKTEVEIEEPGRQLDSTVDSTESHIGNTDPNHKRRSIF